MGLKRAKRDSYRWGVVLSAEPLVGLKLWSDRGAVQSTILSAEPLVGLKHLCAEQLTYDNEPFSRTPRGFEADVHPAGICLPRPFSRTPRGFEASVTNSATSSAPFQPNPSWV